jgi:hypothetical protein
MACLRDISSRDRETRAMNEKNIQKATYSSNYTPQLMSPKAIGSPPPSRDETYSSPLLQPMCWFLLITIVIWLAVALFITAITIDITHNPVNISILAPLASPAYFLYRILKPMLPMDEKRFTLSKMKIQKLPKVELSRNKRSKKNQIPL